MSKSGQDKDQSSLPVLQRKHNIKFTYDSTEDDANSSSESCGKEECLASKRLKKANTTKAKQPKRRLMKKKKPEKQGNPKQSSPTSEHGCDSLASSYVFGPSEGSSASQSYCHRCEFIKQMRQLVMVMEGAVPTLPPCRHSSQGSPNTIESQGSFKDLVNSTDLASCDGREASDMPSADAPAQLLPICLKNPPQLPSPVTDNSEPLTSPLHASEPLFLHPCITSETHGISGTKNQDLPIFKRIDHVWDDSQKKVVQKELNKTPNSNGGDCIFLVNQKFDRSGKQMNTTVEITSLLLKECLQTIMGNSTGHNLAEQNPKFPPEHLFL